MLTSLGKTMENLREDLNAIGEIKRLRRLAPLVDEREQKMRDVQKAKADAFEEMNREAERLRQAWHAREAEEGVATAKYDEARQAASRLPGLEALHAEILMDRTPAPAPVVSVAEPNHVAGRTDWTPPTPVLPSLNKIGDKPTGEIYRGHGTAALPLYEPELHQPAKPSVADDGGNGAA